MQLNQIRHLVEKIGGVHNSTLDPLPKLPQTSAPILQTAPSPIIVNEREVRRSWTDALVSVNATSERLGDVATRVAQVQNRLVTINWGLADYKELADQLLTAAKDLYGHARTELRTLSNLKNSLEIATETKIEEYANNPLYLVDSLIPNSNQVTLPRACTEALVPLIRTSIINRKIGTTSDEVVKRERTQQHQIRQSNNPQLHVSTDAVSGNYGTSQNRFPDFNQEEWVDQNDDYHKDYYLEDSYNDTITFGTEINVTDSLRSRSLGLGETRLQID